ncbi:MAG TPA: hypothetical protein VM513_32365 [Kofleriaceae bacterium]|nr:hypothetical protein [Kofleriaceae bacterium]
MHAIAIAALLAITTSAAIADGFVTRSGQLSGRAVDGEGRALPNFNVHVMAANGVERVLVTGPDGRFGPVANVGTVLVYVHGNATITGSTAVSRSGHKQEVIELSEIMPPAIRAKPVSDPTVVGEYSQDAIYHDAWTRAWLLLEISETGQVTRLKLLDAPGYDLDAIAIRDAFKLRFEPARNAANRSVRSLKLWTFEWPAFSFMKRLGARRRLPPEVATISCRGTGPAHWYRDCREPNLAKVLSEHWIDRSPTSR